MLSARLLYVGTGSSATKKEGDFPRHPAAVVPTRGLSENGLSLGAARSSAACCCVGHSSSPRFLQLGFLLGFVRNLQVGQGPGTFREEPLSCTHNLQHETRGWRYLHLPCLWFLSPIPMRGRPFCIHFLMTTPSEVCPCYLKTLSEKAQAAKLKIFFNKRIQAGILRDS